MSYYSLQISSYKYRAGGGGDNQFMPSFEKHSCYSNDKKRKRPKKIDHMRKDHIFSQKRAMGITSLCQIWKYFTCKLYIFFEPRFKPSLATVLTKKDEPIRPKDPVFRHTHTKKNK